MVSVALGRANPDDWGPFAVPAAPSPDSTLAAFSHDRPPSAGVWVLYGDPLSLMRETGQWKVFDNAGNQVGRMARNWSLPAGMAIDRAVVQGIFTRWAKDQADEVRRQMLRFETWEVVVPKLQLSRRRLSSADGPRHD